MANNNNALPTGFIARNVPGDYDGGTPLPSLIHEKFAVALAAGASKVAAYDLTGRKSANRTDAASKLSMAEHIKRRVKFLREDRARAMTAENVFSGFVSAVESAMVDISDLVKICEHAGLPREAAAARNALQSLAGRVITHRGGLTEADKSASIRNNRLREVLEPFLDIV